MHLSNHHRNTLEQLFDHQASGNVEWRNVRSLLEAVGTVDQEHDGKLRVTVGPETEVLHVPRGKDIDRQTIVDLRRMLSEAGLEPGSPGTTPDERDRNYRDSRWGKPTEDD
ncbi:MAG: type II toxin-antitoxin system HicA family toxin [Solirubrobacterales bacterium]